MTDNYPGYKFDLPDWIESYKTGVPEVRFAAGLEELGLTRDKLLKFTAFQNWIKTLQKSLIRQNFSTHTFVDDPYYLRWIQIQAFDQFPDHKGSKRVFFVKLFAEVTTESGNDYLPGVVFLRGGTVAVLMIVRPSDAPHERYVIMTEQARIAAGSLSFWEIPAGMLDDERNIKSAALREIGEEVGIFLKADDLINMTELAVEDEKVDEDIQSAMYPSPGACDEFINIFLWERTLDRLDIENLKDRLTGDRAAAERITVRLLKYEKLVTVGARDGKTLAAWSLYEYLKRVHPEKLKPASESVFKLREKKTPVELEMGLENAYEALTPSLTRFREQYVALQDAIAPRNKLCEEDKSEKKEVQRESTILGAFLRDQDKLKHKE